MQLSPRTKKKMYVSAVAIFLAVWAWGFFEFIPYSICMSSARERGSALFACRWAASFPSRSVANYGVRMAPIDFELALALAESNKILESFEQMTRLFDRIGLSWDIVQNTAPEDLLPVHRAILLRAKRIDPTTPEYDVFIAAMTRTDLQGDPQ